MMPAGTLKLVTDHGEITEREPNRARNRCFAKFPGALHTGTITSATVLRPPRHLVQRVFSQDFCAVYFPGGGRGEKHSGWPLRELAATAVPTCYAAISCGVSLVVCSRVHVPAATLQTESIRAYRMVVVFHTAAQQQRGTDTSLLQAALTDDTVVRVYEKELPFSRV